MKKLLLATFIISFGLWSCGGSGGGGDDDKPVVKTTCDSSTFNVLVKPIFVQHCNLAGCHSQGAGGVDLRTWGKAKEAVDTKEFLKAINFELTVTRNMPQGQPKLSQRKIDILTCWVNKGCPEN